MQKALGRWTWITRIPPLFVAGIAPPMGDCIRLREGSATHFVRDSADALRFPGLPFARLDLPVGRLEFGVDCGAESRRRTGETGARRVGAASS